MLKFTWKSLKYLCKATGMKFGSMQDAMKKEFDPNMLTQLWIAGRMPIAKRELTEDEADTEIEEITEKKGFVGLNKMLEDAMSESGLFGDGKKKTLQNQAEKD